MKLLINQTLKLLVSCIAVVILHSTIFGQKPSDKVFDAVKEYARKNHKKELLSMEMLHSATEIIYSFSNGSVAPEYQYYGEIIVNPQYVTLNIINQSKLCYTQSRKISARQHLDFLTRLYSLGLKKNTEEYVPMCGGSVYELKIKNGDRTIFKGIEDYDIVTSKGLLSSPFLSLLTTEMRDIYDDPTCTFNASY